MEEIKTTVGDTGGIDLPIEYQKMLDIKPGDEVIMKLVYGEIRIVPLKQAVERAQKIVRKYIPSGRSLAEELIEERREESRFLKDAYDSVFSDESVCREQLDTARLFEGGEVDEGQERLKVLNERSEEG